MEDTGVRYEPKLHSVEDADLPCVDVYADRMTFAFLVILNII